MMKILLYGDQGPSSIQHVSLFTNLRGNTREIQQSDTIVSWDGSTQPTLLVVDPHGYFGPVTVNAVSNGNKLELDFNMTFAKPMLTSDIIIRSWGYDLYSFDTPLLYAWQAVEKLHSQTPTVQIPKSIGPIINNVNSNTTSSLPQLNLKLTSVQNKAELMESIKAWGGYLPKSISDAELLKRMGLKGIHIPSWFMNNTKWIVSGNVAEQEFVNAIYYMCDNKMIR